RERLRLSPVGPGLRAELKSLERLEEDFADILHDLRPLVDFKGWLRLSGRQALFGSVCRFIEPEDWRDCVADLDRVPWIFNGDRDKYRRHLGHCPYCRVRLRLAEGRYWQERAGASELLAGDRFVEGLIE